MSVKKKYDKFLETKGVMHNNIISNLVLIFNDNHKIIRDQHKMTPFSLICGKVSHMRNVSKKCHA